MEPHAGRDQNSVPTLLALSNADGVTVVPIWADPITHRLLVDDSGASGSTIQLPVTGAVNGSNQTFTWTSAPVVIVRDGVSLRQVSADGSVNWTGTTTTVLTIAPNNDVFAGAPQSSGGSGLTPETPVGAVNGANTTYTVSNTPVILVVDGFILDLAAGDYSYVSGTIVTATPPTRYITSYHN